jgi:hypothetical protein
VLRALRYDTVLRVTCYVAICMPGLTILLSLPNYHITTYCIMLGYTTVAELEMGSIYCGPSQPHIPGLMLTGRHLLHLRSVSRAQGSGLKSIVFTSASRLSDAEDVQAKMCIKNHSGVFWFTVSGMAQNAVNRYVLFSDAVF